MNLFFGSGIISGYFSNSYIANELNYDTYSIWHYAKNNSESFYSKLIDICNDNLQCKTKEYYYQIKDKYNILYANNDTSINRAIYFYTLLSLCHGGLIRYANGKFNTSYNNFFSDGRRKINIEDKIKVMKKFISKMEYIDNKNSLEFLKNKFDSKYIIYCDPPYINSDNYNSGWNNDHYQELISILKFQYTHNNIKSIISNYKDDYFISQYDSFIEFNTNRLGNNKNVQRNDIIAFIGK